MNNFDLIVIGGGQEDMFVLSGAQLGLKTACESPEDL